MCGGAAKGPRANIGSYGQLSYAVLWVLEMNPTTKLHLLVLEVNKYMHLSSWILARVEMKTFVVFYGERM